MLTLHQTLTYYKRSDVRSAIVNQCANKEVVVRYNDRFGKRPDQIIYDSDVLLLAQKKATSFHISEETWSNPMQLLPGMRASELDELRVGWDLVIDIDFPFWEGTKLIASRLYDALISNLVPAQAISAKFSGNKGFHIAVPFEAFPYSYVSDSGDEVLVSDLFPDGVRLIISYLVNYVDGPENNFALSSDLIKSFPDQVAQFTFLADANTGIRVVDSSAAIPEFLCANCGFSTRSEEAFLSCEKCGLLMDKKEFKSKTPDVVVRRVDLGVDTMLVSSRHTYRVAYSLHEKSGLVSVPCDPEKLLLFDKRFANPDNLRFDIPFLSRSIPQACASSLLSRAMRFEVPNQPKYQSKPVEWLGDPAPEELFPPAIKKMLGGLRDGRKRALFVLTNFLRCVGWSYEDIDKRLELWNRANPDPLRESVIKSHLRYHSKQKKTVLPPNFDNDMYYKDLGVLVHDELSERLKNPVQYVRLKLKRRS